ncbi:MAG TPA: SulP family inorganic anion transporter [Candidatus Binataceae bacterium]|nr:SulP family inorganic anion transporter [Candidatus Binataceae bacterium]
MASDVSGDGGPKLGEASRPRWLFASFRGYQPSWLAADVIAGLMLGAISIPEQLATARLAGLDPQAGLYALVAGSLGFAIFGANRFVSVGADSTIAPIFAGALATLAAAGSQHYAEHATMVAFLVGAMLVTVGVVGAGWIADLLSIPVTVGFLAGISAHIIVGQLPSILGIAGPTGYLLSRIAIIARHLPNANLYALAIGAAVLAITAGAERIGPRVPGALIAIVAAAIAVVALDLKARGVAVLDPLPHGLPGLTLPQAGELGFIGRLLPAALVVAAVCMMQTTAVVRSFPSDPGVREDVSRDFAGVGAGCILAGLIGAFAVDASPPCTAIVKESGGRSQLATLTQVAMALALVFFAAGLTAYVPKAALGGLLVYIGMRIFKLGDMIKIARRGGYEIIMVALSAGLVILMPIETGMLLAIVLSLVHSLYMVARPRCSQLSRVPGTTIWWPPSPEQPGERVPGVVVFAPAAPIYFTNAEFICERLKAEVAAAQDPVRLVVIEAIGVIDIDYTGSQVLQETIAQLRGAAIDVAFCRMEAPRAQAAAKQTRLFDAVGADHMFRSAEEAVHNLANHLEAAHRSSSHGQGTN